MIPGPYCVLLMESSGIKSLLAYINNHSVLKTCDFKRPMSLKSH